MCVGICPCQIDFEDTDPFDFTVLVTTEGSFKTISPWMNRSTRQDILFYFVSRLTQESTNNEEIAPLVHPNSKLSCDSTDNLYHTENI